MSRTLSGALAGAIVFFNASAGAAPPYPCLIAGIAAMQFPAQPATPQQLVDIVGQVQQGSAEARVALMENLNHIAWPIILSRVSNHGRAFEILQELQGKILIAVVTAASLPNHGLNPANILSGPIVGYLCTSTHNAINASFRDQLRGAILETDLRFGASAHPPGSDVPHALDELAGPGLSPIEELLLSENHERLTRLVQQLPPESQQLLQMRAQGMSSQAIGAALGITDLTARQRLLRLIQRLRAALSGL